MAVFGGVETAFADSIYSFTTIDVPGALSTSPSGINDSGQIVGGFWDGLKGHGFLYRGGSFTTIDVPVGVGDFNGDGHADVLWFNANTGAGAWHRAGDGSQYWRAVRRDAGERTRIEERPAGPW
jgi:probable HAF family extracellular repeat protein